MAWSHQRQKHPQHFNSTAWVVGLVKRGNRKMAWYHQRQIPHRTLNSSAWVAYRAHDSVNSVSILILKHRHELVTDCHQLLIVLIVL